MARRQAADRAGEVVDLVDGELQGVLAALAQAQHRGLVVQPTVSATASGRATRTAAHLADVEGILLGGEPVLQGDDLLDLQPARDLDLEAVQFEAHDGAFQAASTATLSSRCWVAARSCSTTAARAE